MLKRGKISCYHPNTFSIAIDIDDHKPEISDFRIRSGTFVNNGNFSMKYENKHCTYKSTSKIKQRGSLNAVFPL